MSYDDGTLSSGTDYIPNSDPFSDFSISVSGTNVTNVQYVDEDDSLLHQKTIVMDEDVYSETTATVNGYD